MWPLLRYYFIHKPFTRPLVQGFFTNKLELFMRATQINQLNTQYS